MNHEASAKPNYFVELSLLVLINLLATFFLFFSLFRDELNIISNKIAAYTTHAWLG